MFATESYNLLLLTAAIVVTIPVCWIILHYLGISQRLKQNKAKNTGPTTWSEAIAFRIVMSLFRRAHRSGWRESLRRNFNQWILGRMNLESHSWARTLSDGKTRFIWKVRIPVLYGALALPEGRCIEVIVPLKGATDKDLKRFSPKLADIDNQSHLKPI